MPVLAAGVPWYNAVIVTGGTLAALGYVALVDWLDRRRRR